MRYNYNFAYDEEIKKKYVDEYDTTSNDVRNVISSRLLTIDNYEIGCNKRVLDWTSHEISDYFRCQNSKSKISIYNYYITLVNYANFVYAETKKNEDNVLPNFLADITMYNINNILQLVNVRKIDESYLSYDAYMEILNNREIVNFAKVMVVLFYHSVPVEKIDDIFLLKRSVIDFDNKTIQTTTINEIDKLNDVEMSILNQFEVDQTIEVEEYEGNLYPVVETGIGTKYICIKDSDRLFHPVVAFSATTGDSIRYLRKKETEKPFTFSKGVARRIFAEMAVVIDRKAMRPKNIIKSGSLNKMVEEFGLTKDEVSEYGLLKMEWRRFINKTCRFTLDEVELACEH